FPCVVSTLLVCSMAQRVHTFPRGQVAGFPSLKAPALSPGSAGTLARLQIFPGSSWLIILAKTPSGVCRGDLLSTQSGVRTFVTLLLAESLMVGGTTGFFAGLLGVGGGFIMIPLLTVMGVPIHTAVGTCLAFVAGSGLAGLFQHVRQKSIDPIVALTMTLPATLTSMVLAHFSSLVSRPVL